MSPKRPVKVPQPRGANGRLGGMQELLNLPTRNWDYSVTNKVPGQIIGETIIHQSLLPCYLVFVRLAQIQEFKLRYFPSLRSRPLDRLLGGSADLDQNATRVASGV